MKKFNLMFIFLILAGLFGTLHDLYFWNESIQVWVDSFGWHIIKLLYLGTFFFSVYFMEKSFKAILYWISFRWLWFEFFYNILNKDAKMFDWLRYLNAAIHGQGYGHYQFTNFFEFILHHCTRLHYIESLALIIVLLGGCYVRKSLS